MNNRFCFSFFLLFFCLAFALPALGRKENTSGTCQSGRIVQVSGQVRLIGNSPFYELVITNSEGEWYISKEDSHKLNDLQYQTITVEGLETSTELTFGNGLPAGTRRELSNIKIKSK